jgi:hypothetical protein
MSLAQAELPPVSRLQALKILRAATPYDGPPLAFDPHGHPLESYGSKKITIAPENLISIMGLPANTTDFIRLPFSLSTHSMAADGRVIINIDSGNPKNLEAVARKTTEEVCTMGEHAFNVLFGAALLEQRQAALLGHSY